MWFEEPWPPAPLPLAWETEAMLTCAVIAQSLALDCTGFYKTVCYVKIYLDM